MSSFVRRGFFSMKVNDVENGGAPGGGFFVILDFSQL